MKYIKQIISMLVAMTLIFILTSCAKCISTETSTVEVKVIDKYYRSAYVTPVNCGKSITMITHPAVYKIMVEYEGNEYAFYGIDYISQNMWRRLVRTPMQYLKQKI